MVQPADLTSQESVEKLWNKAKAELGPIHVLINVAGTMSYSTMGTGDPSQWWNDYEVNVKGSFLMNHYFINQGGGRGTTIIVSTGAASLSAPGFSSYATSKLAQTRFTEFLQLGTSLLTSSSTNTNHS